MVQLTNNRLLFTGNSRPTLFENWILWMFSFKSGYYEWFDTIRAVRAGGGLCSQHAIVLNNILRSQGIESRIIAVGGHVLNEVFFKGSWHVCDATYNVFFNEPLNQLENEPKKIYRTYRAHNVSHAAAENLMRIFSSKNDNYNYKTSCSFGMDKCILEKSALLLIWLIPSLLIMAGLLFLVCAIKKKKR